MILDDFKAQVDVELNIQSGKTADCGLVFCAEDSNPNGTFFFYAFTVSRNGFYRLHRSSKTEAKAIIDWQSTDLIHPGDATNSLLIEKSGKTVTLGINGQIVATTTDGGLRPGCVGMFVQSYKDDLYAEARFRNFCLYANET